MGKGGAVLGLIGIILGAGGIGFGFFNMIGQNNNLTQARVVGVWDGLAVNQDYPGYDQIGSWLFEYTLNEMNYTGYILVENSNTKITLLIPGWYRIHLSVELISLDPGLHYYVRLLKDHIADEVFYHIDHNTLLPAEDIYYIESSMLVYSDGTNYIEVRGTVTDATINGFGIGGSPNNRFSIEFVST